MLGALFFVYLRMENTEIRIEGTNYFANRKGDIITYNWRNTGRRAVLKPATDRKGYKRVGLIVEGKLVTRKVHRLIAECFIDNKNKKPQVNHIDGNKANNNVNNLEWVTQSENKKHSFKLGLENNNGSNNPYSKLTEQDVVSMRFNYDNGIKTVRDMVGEYQIHPCTVRRIVKRKTWTHI